MSSSTMPILLPDRADISAFGDFLRSARERRGLTLQQISNETKIPWRHLDALEHGNFAVVPAGMYRRAEIRAYAAAVGLDQGLALAELEHALEAAIAPESKPSARLPLLRKLSTHSVALGAAGVVLLMITLLFVWDRLAGTATTSASTASTPAPSSASLAQPATPPAADSIGDASAPEARTSSSVPQPAPIVAAGSAADVGSEAVAQAMAPSDSEELVVTTEPAGARVVVDGIGYGATPVVIRNLSSGSRRIRVVKDGYVSEERVVRYTGRGMTLSILLTERAAAASSAAPDAPR